MPIAIRLPNDMEQRLNNLASSTGRNKSFYVKEAVLRYLDELEDVYLAEKRLEDLRKGKAKASSIDAVSKELGL